AYPPAVGRKCFSATRPSRWGSTLISLRAVMTASSFSSHRVYRLATTNPPNNTTPRSRGTGPHLPRTKVPTTPAPAGTRRHHRGPRSRRPRALLVEELGAEHGRLRAPLETQLGEDVG